MKTVTLNRDMLCDKIHGAWMGKNIGGTIGAPYEGKRSMLDIQGFNSKPGEPLPNDDLDLQLIWLCSMEKQGPWNFNSRTLGEYWLQGIVPNWNEYGEGKGNMRFGYLPPLSGEMHNERWRDSNGAWIRSEI